MWIGADTLIAAMRTFDMAENRGCLLASECEHDNSGSPVWQSGNARCEDARRGSDVGPRCGTGPCRIGHPPPMRPKLLRPAAAKSEAPSNWCFSRPKRLGLPLRPKAHDANAKTPDLHELSIYNRRQDRDERPSPILIHRYGHQRRDQSQSEACGDDWTPHDRERCDCRQPKAVR